MQALMNFLSTKQPSLQTFILYPFFFIFLFSCADGLRVTTTTQRIIIQRPTTMYKLVGERRTLENIGTALEADTIISFATAIAPTEAGNRKLFYVIWGNVEAWFDADSGTSGTRALSEYDAAAGVCDTKFTLPAELDSIAWKRALDYVNTHTSDIIQYATPTLIQTSKRNRLPNSISFTVKRSPTATGEVQFSVRANDIANDMNARKCAFFMQTGRDERHYQGLENVYKKKK